MRSSAISYSVAAHPDPSEIRERGLDLKLTTFGHQDIFSQKRDEFRYII
jgi:hypothetical protein